MNCVTGFFSFGVTEATASLAGFAGGFTGHGGQVGDGEAVTGHHEKSSSKSS